MVSTSYSAMSLPPGRNGQMFGLALAVCGAAAAPLAVGAVSELFQHQYGMNEGDSLRWAMVIASGTIMSLGTWYLWLASRTAAADAQKVLADFLAERMRRD
jgi:ABC-type nickel/cobalt efflux system permease component RcnA